VNPEREDRSTGQAEAGRERVGETIEDDRIGAEGEVARLGHHGSDGHDDPPGPGQDLASGRGRELLQANRVRHWWGARRWWWLVAFAGAELAAAEWIRAPAWSAASVAVIGLVLAALGTIRRGRSGLLFGAVLVAEAAIIMAATVQLRRIETEWPRIRERFVTSAAATWEQELRTGRLAAERIATAAAGIDLTSQQRAFEALDDLVTGQSLEVGVVVVEADGIPFAWAGRYRLMPEAKGDSIDFHASPYYAVIESRRHLQAGRTVIAAVLLAADSTVPDRGRTLASRFERRSGVGLEILPPGVAPDTSDVFDYIEPTTSGPRLLFSVQLTPPTQGAAHERVYHRAVARMVATGLLALVLAVFLAPAGLARFALLALPPLIAVRAPLGAALGSTTVFSPRTFFHPLLGPLSESAGPLALAALTVSIASLGLFRRRRHRSWRGAPIALLLLLAAPYLVSRLGRGIQAPIEGVPFGLWLTWETTVFLVAAAILLPAAAALPERRDAPLWRPIAGSVIAIVAAIVGLFIWNARHGWPDWYPLLWTAALGFVIWPGRREATVAGLGIAAGSAAALMVWGAEVESRVASARADLGSLGARVDPVVVPLLERFVAQVALERPPRTTSELFALWRSAPLSRQGFPVSLGLFGPDGAPGPQLKLSELDLPDTLMARLVRELPPTETQWIAPLQRAPSVHYVALVRLDPKTTLGVGLGPRTSLVPEARLGRLLQPTPQSRPLYTLTLSPTFSVHQPREGGALWRRDRWTARGDRTVAMGDGARDVYGVVELGHPPQLLIRGALLVVFDLALLLGLLALAGWLADGRLGRPAWLPERRSFRTRVALSLGAFFLAPAIGFALLNILELARDRRSRRELQIAQTLRDAAPGRTLPLALELDKSLEALSERVDANLVLYQNGRLIASNGGGVFEDFGVVNPLIDPDAFVRIQINGEQSTVTKGPSEVAPTLIGVRSIRLSTGDPAILGSPQTTDDPTIAAQQLDLAYGVALAVVAGLLAALIGAQLSARALSRPAADLRDAALAFGRGEPLPPPSERAPAEFEPVFNALEKMASDIRATQEAQERAARVLAWGEMANQIAHEVKNPLTPMRLGIQHLLRLHRDGRPLGPPLEETSRRILGEIDRLDTIARAFSRFGAPAESGTPLESIGLEQVCREVVALYQLAPAGSRVVLRVERDAIVGARRDEVKETLINLLENARNAEAATIRVEIDGPMLRVVDDGSGIPAEQLPRIFEPRFSTTTSGSGLGLAIVKRLVESWGATIEVASEVDEGTTITIRFAPSPDPAQAPGGEPPPA
jgi:signal transduction histidine kinase